MPKYSHEFQIDQPNRYFRIVLNDVMDCVVRLRRLSDSEIERAINGEISHLNQRPCHNRPNLLASHHIDHNYSLLHQANVCTLTITIFLFT